MKIVFDSQARSINQYGCKKKLFTAMQIYTLINKVSRKISCAGHCPIILKTQHLNLNILLFPCIVSQFIAYQQHAHIRQKSVLYYCTLHFHFSRSK
jgi:hypothetical protein